MGNTFGADTAYPAFAVLLLGAADAHGDGFREMRLFSATHQLEAKWTAIVQEAGFPGHMVMRAQADESLAIPFGFLVAWAPHTWEGRPVMVNDTKLRGAYASALRRDQVLAQRLAQ